MPQALVFLLSPAFQGVKKTASTAAQPEVAVTSLVSARANEVPAGRFFFCLWGCQRWLCHSTLFCFIANKFLLGFLLGEKTLAFVVIVIFAQRKSASSFGSWNIIGLSKIGLE